MRRLAAVLVLAVLAALVPATAAHALDRAELRRALAREMTRVSRASGAYVRDLETDAPLYARKASVARIPASVQKLVTTSAALRRLGPDAVLRTVAVTDAELGPDGVLRGDVVLRGGGDPTLTRGSLTLLATELRELGFRRVTGSVLGDESAFDAHRGSSRTAGAYDRDMGGVLSALAVSRGFSRDGRPAAEAARRLAKALRAAGVRVDGRSGEGLAPAGARELAVLVSPPLATLARTINAPSNNFAAELLLKALAADAAADRPGSTARGAAAARAELRALGVRARVADGSGLARANRIAPREVVDLLDGMEEDTVAGPAFLRSLAVAGRSGTLARRMRGTAAAGRCRAKTGSINGVSTLAGYCASRDEGLLGFAFLMNGTSHRAARRAQDRMAAALARYDG